LDAESAADRRTTPRFALLVQLAKLISCDREFLCVVEDASTDGVRVRHFGHMPSESLLQFELSNGEVFPVQRVWQDDEYLALRFPEEVDLQRLAKLTGNDRRRRAIRLNTELQGAVIDGAQFHCTVIRNISQHGLCIECRDELEIGQLVEVETDSLQSAAARVRWRIATIYGLVFEEELPHEALAAAVADQPIR
jgi:hypothetical protein